MAAPCRRPQTGVLLLSSAEVDSAARGRMVSFGRNWPLAAPPGPGTARNQNLSTVGTSGLPRQPLATILGPFPTASPNFDPCPLPETLTPLPFYFFGFSVTRQTAMPIRTAPRFCLGGCGWFEKLLYGCRDPSRLHVSGPWPISDTQTMCC